MRRPRRRRRAAPGSDDALPEAGLVPAPRLVPPPPVNPPAPPSGARPPRPLAVPAVTPSDGAIFLRADRIDGTADRFVEAAGKVELRTRRDTVLADWLRYDFVSDEIWGKGDVLIRHGIDWITGPEVRFKRGTETGFFTSPRFFLGENGSRGSAAEIRFAGPDRYEATDARYTTCVAPREDWYIRMGELEIDKARMVGTGHDATVYFFGAPVDLFAVVRVPAVERAQVGFPHADHGLDRHSRLRVLAALLPQSRAQLRRDDHAAPHDQARPADRRPGALPVRQRPGRGRRGVPAQRPRDGHEPVRPFVQAHAESGFPARPHRLLEPQQGLRRHLLRRSRRTASDSRRRRRCRAKAGSPTPTGRGSSSPGRRLSRRCRIPRRRSRFPTIACRRRW